MNADAPTGECGDHGPRQRLVDQSSLRVHDGDRRSGKRTSGLRSILLLALDALMVCGANGAPYRTRRGAGVSPAMPVFLPAFLEEHRHGRRRGNLKGRSTKAQFLRRITLDHEPQSKFETRYPGCYSFAVGS